MFSEVAEIARVAQRPGQFQQLLKTRVILILNFTGPRAITYTKRAGLGPNELVQFYPTYTRPITEYACPVFMMVYLYIFLAS